MDVDRAAEHLDVAGRAVGEQVLEERVLLVLGGRPAQYLEHLSGWKGHQVGDVEGGEPLPRIAVEVHRRLVHVDDVPMHRIDHQHDGMVIVEEAVVSLIALPKLLQRLAPLYRVTYRALQGGGVHLSLHQVVLRSLPHRLHAQVLIGVACQNDDGDRSRCLDHSLHGIEAGRIRQAKVEEYDVWQHGRDHLHRLLQAIGAQYRRFQVLGVLKVRPHQPDIAWIVLYQEDLYLIVGRSALPVLSALGADHFRMLRDFAHWM